MFVNLILITTRYHSRNSNMGIVVVSKKAFGKKPKELLSVKLARPSNKGKHWIIFSGGFPIPARFGIAAMLVIVAIVFLFNAPDSAIAKELVTKVFDVIEAIWKLRPTK